MKYSRGTLSDFIEFNPRESLPKGNAAKEVAMADLIPFQKKISNYNISPYKGGMKFRNGDTLLARITPCLENGKTAYVDILNEDEVGFGSTEYIVLRAIPQKTIPEFVFYFAISDWFRKRAIALMTGSSGRQRVQTDKLMDLEVIMPDLETQKKIVRVLSALDQKIELNHKTSNNLLRISHQVYLKEIKGATTARTEKLGRLCRIKYGKGLPTSKVLKNGYRVYGGNGIIGFYNEKMYDESQVLISCRGAASGKVIFTRPECFVTNNSLILECDEKYHYFVKEYSLDREYYDYTTGSAQPQITIDNIKDVELPLPNDEVLIKFNDTLRPIEKKFFAILDENEALAKLRDILLPKLISNEISLEKAVIQ